MAASFVSSVSEQMITESAAISSIHESFAERNAIRWTLDGSLWNAGANQVMYPQQNILVSDLVQLNVNQNDKY